MPSVKKGETKEHYMARCVPQLIKEGKKQDQAVAQCISMFKSHWQAHGGIEIDVPQKEVNDEKTS